METLENHPGWHEGARIQTKEGKILTVLTNGNYISDGISGLWHYRVRLPTGETVLRVPQMGDKPIP